MESADTPDTAATLVNVKPEAPEVVPKHAPGSAELQEPSTAATELEGPDHEASSSVVVESTSSTHEQGTADASLPASAERPPASSAADAGHQSLAFRKASRIKSASVNKAFLQSVIGGTAGTGTSSSPTPTASMSTTPPLERRKRFGWSRC